MTLPRPRPDALLVAALFTLGLAAGCKEASAPSAAPTPDAGPSGDEETTYPDAWRPTTPTGHGSDVTIDPVIALDGKVARRVTVDQLRRSIPRLFAGITWTIGQGQRQAVGFDSLARTLGEADYIQTNSNNTDASPLFAKFMDDMAGDVCTKAIAHDRTAAHEDKLVIREPDADANLRYLRLKLHAVLVPAGSTDGIAELRQLHDAVVGGGGSDEDGWLAVCVAMLTAPEMMAY